MKPVDLYYKMPYIIRYPIFVFKGYFQAKYRYGEEFHNIFKKLMGNITLSKDEIQSLQRKMMQQLLLHAFEHVPYYKRTFQQINFHPSDYHTENDLNYIPILTKDIIKENFNDLIADNIPDKMRALHQSGGTTGVPLRFYLPKNLRGPFNFATLYRFYHWAGISFRDSRVSVAGRLTTRRPPYSMFNPAENQLYVCAHYLNEENLDSITKSIVKFKPKFIQGHPSALAVLSGYMIEEQITLPVKAIFTTSENLYEDQRLKIERAFKSKIFDNYGMGEMVTYGSECTMHNGYHLAPEYGITEVVNQEAYDGSTGELISTSLQNYAMPFIRYKCGDLGKTRTESCPCGCNFPMLDKIYGRIDDVIITANGKCVLPLTIRIQMKNAGFSDFQLIQDKLNYELLFFTSPDFKEQEYIVDKAKSVLFKILGPESVIKISFDSEPVKTIYGKQQMILKKKESAR